MKIRTPKIKMNHYLLSEKGLFYLFNVIISLTITGMLAYIIFLAPLQINNWIAAVITSGIFICSVKWLRDGLRKRKPDQDQAARDQLR